MKLILSIHAYLHWISELSESTDHIRLSIFLTCSSTLFYIFLQAVQAAGLVPSDLGQPVDRRPRTAIVNTVKYHTEIVASLAYHFTKLNHNVTIFARDDSLGIERVIHPFHWRGIRRYERFYDSFYEYDIVVFATYPTCHLGLAQNLLALGLPQRYLAVLHNPELLATEDAAAALLAAQHSMQLLTITPHVNSYANSILEAEGLGETLVSQWFAPIFPVLYPEDCGDPTLRSPSGFASEQPSCNRSAVWHDTEFTTPLIDADEGEEEDAILGRTLKAASEEGKEKSTSSSNSSSKGGLNSSKGALGKPPGVKRQGFCVQGKQDPNRRSYDSLFGDLAARRETLLASDFSLVLQGKGGGKTGEDILDLPSHLEEDGLVRRYTSLPFQEYYELLHSCIAIMPAFASEAYYIHKGSSSVAASFIAGTPLIVTPRTLAAYSFLDASAVFLVPEGTKDIDAMEAVMALPPEVVQAKHASMKALRHQLYDRNLALFQAVVGEQFLYKKRLNKGKDLEATVMWYDASGPLWTAEPLRQY